VACSVGGVTPGEVARPLAPYLLLLLGFIVLMAFVPEIALLLPRLMGY
jgi:TRAP-type C4-dicarboxylate transport system permease large subunit